MQCGKVRDEPMKNDKVKYNDWRLGKYDSKTFRSSEMWGLVLVTHPRSKIQVL